MLNIIEKNQQKEDILNSSDRYENNTVGKTNFDNFLNETRMIENESEKNGYVSKKKSKKNNENKEEMQNQMNINCEEQANAKPYKSVEK